MYHMGLAVLAVAAVVVAAAAAVANALPTDTCSLVADRQVVNLVCTCDPQVPSILEYVHVKLWMDASLRLGSASNANIHFLDSNTVGGLHACTSAVELYGSGSALSRSHACGMTRHCRYLDHNHLASLPDNANGSFSGLDNLQLLCVRVCSRVHAPRASPSRIAGAAETCRTMSLQMFMQAGSNRATWQVSKHCACRVVPQQQTANCAHPVLLAHSILSHNDIVWIGPHAFDSLVSLITLCVQSCGIT